MGDKKTKSKGISSYKKKRTKSKKLRKRTSTKRKSNSKQRTIEKQRKIIAEQSVIISKQRKTLKKQRKTLKKQRKKLSKSLNGGARRSKGRGRGRSGRSGKKKRNTRSQQQRQRRLKREMEREEELRQQELREEQPSDIEWRWEQDVLNPVITQATAEEIERTSEAHARSSEPSHFELWQQAQERDKELSKRLAEEAAQKKREKELEAAAQEQEQEELASVASPEEAVKEKEAEEIGSDVDTDEELEDILRDTDEQLRELQEEEEKTSGISPFAQSSTVETGYESQEREPEIETKVASPFTSSPAARLEEQSSSESEYGSDVTQEGDPSGFTPFGQYSETEADPNDPKIFTSSELPLAQQSESESEGELGREWSSESRLPSEWEKEEELEEQKKTGFLSGIKSKLSEATQRKPVEPGLFPTRQEEQEEEDESEYETDSDTSSVISQDDPELQEFESFGREEESEDEGELTTFAQPYGLTAPKNPTDIPSYEPSGISTQKKTSVSSEKPGKLASTFQKLKSVFSRPDYEQLLKTNSEELKELYISYLNEHFDDIKEGEDIDTIKENYVKFVNQYYKEAFQKDKLLLEKLKDA
tara:strand:- start:20668 stop:22440 length:1773 start_codon:yes stop_codon:yes gene_type:complete